MLTDDEWREGTLLPATDRSWKLLETPHIFSSKAKPSVTTPFARLLPYFSRRLSRLAFFHPFVSSSFVRVVLQRQLQLQLQLQLVS
jgi:hypothetical protein